MNYIFDVNCLKVVIPDSKVHGANCRSQMGPMLAPWTLLSGTFLFSITLSIFMATLPLSSWFDILGDGSRFPTWVIATVPQNCLYALIWTVSKWLKQQAHQQPNWNRLHVKIQFGISLGVWPEVRRQIASCGWDCNHWRAGILNNARDQLQMHHLRCWTHWARYKMATFFADGIWWKSHGNLFLSVQMPICHHKFR